MVIPSLTVYVSVKASEREMPKSYNFFVTRKGFSGSLYNDTAHSPFDNRNDKVIEWLEPRSIPDPSYINAIINDPASDTDKIQRLQKYLNEFDNLPKY